MSGGAYEYVAAYLNNGHLNLTRYGSTLVNALGKYKDVYSTGSSDSYERNYAVSTPDRGYYGDAMWETSSSGTRITSWYSDGSGFPYSSSLFFRRGGYCTYASDAGVFFFDDYDGNCHSSLRFPRGRARILM